MTPQQLSQLYTGTSKIKLIDDMPLSSPEGRSNQSLAPRQNSVNEWVLNECSFAISPVTLQHVFAVDSV